MENGAKNKAILPSPWGTTGQCLRQTTTNFLLDYFEQPVFLGGKEEGGLWGHDQKNKII